jgi:hypothetical protein
MVERKCPFKTKKKEEEAMMKGSEKVTRRQRKKGKGRYHMHLLSNVGR